MKCTTASDLSPGSFPKLPMARSGWRLPLPDTTAGRDARANVLAGVYSGLSVWSFGPSRKLSGVGFGWFKRPC